MILPKVYILPCLDGLKGFFSDEIGTALTLVPGHDWFLRLQDFVNGW